MYQGEGYKTTTPMQLCNLLAALTIGLISFKAVRVFFACLELEAIREAAARSQKGKKKKSRGVLYRIEEIERLTGLSPSVIKQQLAALEKAGILLFSESLISLTRDILPFASDLLRAAIGERSPNRAIPIPRCILYFLASCKQQSVAVTLIAYIIRSLSLRRSDSEIKAAGTAKALWVAQTFGLSLRAVRGARKELLRLGLISPDDNSTQRKLNRTGSYFVVNTSWKPQKQESSKIDLGEKAPVEIAEVGEKLEVKLPEFAPPQPENCTNFAPPYKYKETSKELKNQKTRQAENSGFLIKKQGKPRLENIQPEDLKRVSTLLVLFAQAVKAGWLKDTEANKLKFLSAAVRANAVGNDPVRVFVTIVRRELWHHITQEQEDRAAQALKRYQGKQQQKTNASHSTGFAKLFCDGGLVLRAESWTIPGMVRMGEIVTNLARAVG